MNGINVIATDAKMKRILIDNSNSNNNVAVSFDNIACDIQRRGGAYVCRLLSIDIYCVDLGTLLPLNCEHSGQNITTAVTIVIMILCSFLFGGTKLVHIIIHNATNNKMEKGRPLGARH